MTHDYLVQAVAQRHTTFLADAAAARRIRTERARAAAPLRTRAGRPMLMRRRRTVVCAVCDLGG